MKDLFVLSAPWWHFVLRAVAIYAMVMVMIRLSGKRAVGQFTPFDMLLIVLLGNAVQNALLGLGGDLAPGGIAGVQRPDDVLGDGRLLGNDQCLGAHTIPFPHARARAHVCTIKLTGFWAMAEKAVNSGAEALGSDPDARPTAAACL